MSLANDREQLAAILSAIPGVKGHKYRPRTFGPGDAWALVPELTRDDTTPGYEATWNVVVVLPSNEDRASRWFDDNHELIADTLSDEFGWVNRIDSGPLQSEAGDIYIMLITLIREA